MPKPMGEGQPLGLLWGVIALLVAIIDLDLRCYLSVLKVTGAMGHMRREISCAFVDVPWLGQASSDYPSD